MAFFEINLHFRLFLHISNKLLVTNGYLLLVLCLITHDIYIYGAFLLTIGCLYLQQQQALMPRNTVAEEDELTLMHAVERLEIVNKTEPVRHVRRNTELPEKVVLL